MKSNQKILSLEALSERVSDWRGQFQKVVHCHGVFDLLHYGHLKHLDSARRLGDRLIVTITPDRFVNKGPGRPVFSEQQRAESLAALECVDAVAINLWPTSTETLRLVQPDIYAKGIEYQDHSQDITGKISEEAEAVAGHGGQIAYTDDQVYSSSHLLNQNFVQLAPEVMEFVEKFKQKHSFKEVLACLEQMRSLKVAVVGEAIIDEYQYCHAIGKSSKEATLVVAMDDLERFAGGSLAVANHIAQFCGETHLVAMLGAQKPELQYVESQLHPAVHRHFILRADGPTIVKRRFVEQYFSHKLFEVYEMQEQELTPPDDLILGRKLVEVLSQCDVVVVVDYGHGFLSQDAIKILTEHSKFLAVNAQSNAGNLGFHTASLYPRADFFCLTEKELRLEARRRSGTVEELILSVIGKLNTPRLCTTQGIRGCLLYDQAEGFCRAPAIADKVVDRVGAGDAFLSVASLAMACGAPLVIAGLLGNAAGAQAVATLCNREPVQRQLLLRHIETLLK